MSAVLVVLVGCGGSIRKEQEHRAAHLRVSTAAVMMSGQAASCASHFRALWSAWEYAKVSGEDFASASAAVLGPEFSRMRQQLIAGKAEVEDLLARLDPVPEGLQRSVEKLKELQEIYLEIFDLAVNPPGSIDGSLEKLGEWEEEFDVEAGMLETMLSETGTGEER